MDEENIKESITQSPENFPVKNKKPWLMIILIFLVILTSGAAGLFAYQNYLLKSQTQKQEDTLKISPSPIPTITTDSTYKLISDEDEQQALKDVIAKELEEKPENIGIGHPFIKFKDWYYLNAGVIGTPSGASIYIRKDKNELKVVYLGQECPPENLVTQYPDIEINKIPIDTLNLRCSPYYTVKPN